MSMGQSQESTNIDETKETIKREVLDFIAQYGCGKAPDEAFDTLGEAYLRLFNSSATSHTAPTACPNA
mgnify:CR=1 FL=1